MSTLASYIIGKASELLKDEGTTSRWPDADMFEWLSIGEKVIVFLKPDAYVLNSSFQLAAGTKQSLPEGTVQLVEIIRNMGKTGTTAGRAIRNADRAAMDRTNPDWHTSSASWEVQLAMYDKKDPTRFYVAPPQPASGQGYIEVARSAAPDDLVASTSASPIYAVNITLGDIYQNALVDYLMFRAYLKDADTSQYAQDRAVYYWNLFVMQLDRKDLVEDRDDPNMTRVKKAGTNA